MQTRISLALSGGGSRAIAFHLGCFRSLHRHNLLDDVGVVSAVSGGSVLAAAYFKFGGEFEVFEERVLKMLESGLVKPAFGAAFGLSGIWWIIGEIIFLVLWIALRFAKLICWVFHGLLKAVGWDLPWLACWRLPLRRWTSRTRILEQGLDIELFGGANFDDLKLNGKKLIINTTELTTGSAFRFSTGSSGGWRFGELQGNFKAAHAVAASAAYPLYLTHFQERYKFIRKDGSEHAALVSLTDGGVYDNLGVGPFWPDRSPDISLDTDEHRTIICCSAGYGLRASNHPTFWYGRMVQVLSTALERAQNAAVKQLHELKKTGEIETLIFPFLGMQDDNLPTKPEGLVPRKEVHAYPTNFSKMPKDKIDRISLRGEQLTDYLLKLYGQNLLSRD